MCDQQAEAMNTHRVLVLPARLQEPALPAVVEPRPPVQRWPDARSTAPLLERRVQRCEGQPTLTALTGLTREEEREKKTHKDQHREAWPKQAITFQPVGRSKKCSIPTVRTQFKPDP